MKKADDTPMMQQYWSAKKRHPGELLFFRMGDFYEMFHDDAKEAARILGIALTSRNKGPDAIPMAGVPVRSVKHYLGRLLAAGKRVAICEQLEDPATAKGLVDRDVVRIVTPGTLTDEDCLDERSHLYLLAVSPRPRETGIAWVDLSTGDFLVHAGRDQAAVAAEIDRIGPAECLVPEGLWREGTLPLLGALKARRCSITPSPDWNFGVEAAERRLKEHFETASLEGFGLERAGPAVEAAGALLRYLYETQRHELKHITTLRVHHAGRFLRMNERTRNALEIARNARGGPEGTLIAHLDATATAMGARLLRAWIMAPLADVEAIDERLDAVQDLHERRDARHALREQLLDVADLERLAGRVALGSAHGRDLAAIGRSLGCVPDLAETLGTAAAPRIAQLRAGLGDFADLCGEIARVLIDEPPFTVHEGGLIKDGVSAELDELRELARESGTWLANFQRRQIERTGIANLKVGFQRVFGYYIEVTRAQAERVPADFSRTQTLKNCERYTTPELKSYEGRILNAQERIADLEYALFAALRDRVAAEIPRIQATARAIAELDVLGTFAHLAALHGYVRPVLTEEKVLRVTDSRHPVIEQALADGAFVPNDVRMEAEAPVAIITGPNMAGKSTYIRQAALLVLMAQAGCFVPARSAEIGRVDQIFARVGAADDIFHGRSTFMVEMIETAGILNSATERSLIILDEVGRGTSTFDGMSIAWAVTEHIYERIKARTFFATHYHELTELALLHPGIRNLNVAVKEHRDEIVFLRKILDGATDKSYGLQVARLAALPRGVLERAREILANLERQAVSPNDTPSFAPPKGSRKQYVQLDLFTDRREEFLKKLAKLDLDALPPIEALKLLAELRHYVM
ncbi:MAG TPA: DNA mismatch repair protein MutS [Planctomycetota bacterium]|nr:MAG: DNA mismatch repair protein MutS [Planctomycetes bacterium ADurb.Bin069]HNR98599.1 DNA mismatch repair protein MutS [Planctomycetota bacterium]HNU26144.1 DNA mismatch repair protein MutS [Planctomycetota bacterium]HOE28823.1 DNA mismatch repair protein MutS [Planctomycetota bacterium]HOE85418.1 DNA mismatch repair protein MutS [Planctomycetota bacterium]